MDRRHQKRIRIRTVILAFFFFLWAAGLTFRLIQIQVVDHPRLKAQVLHQNQNKDTILPVRGTIYDRKGKIFARSLPAPSVFLYPFEDETPAAQMEKINKLKGILNLSYQEIQRIKARIKKGDLFIWIKRKIDQQQAERVKNLRLPGIFLKLENKRYYPQKNLAAHVLGGVSIDDEGLGGVEWQYNSRLRGKRGERLILRDAKKREYNFEILKEPEPGKDLVLAVDETIQYIVEKELKKVVLQHRASWGTVIVAVPSTGEILAMANYPTYDPNKYPPSWPESARNRAIHYNFEPGSTFKIVTAMAALEANRIALNDTFDCGEGVIHLAGKTIRDHKKFGRLTFPEVIQHSSNVGAIKIGQLVGESFFFEKIKAYGFGERTGIDLPGEEKGIFRKLSDWSRISLASLSFGQEISVTAVQLLQTMNIIANRGLITTPKIVKKILLSENEVRERPSHHKRVLSKKAASTMIEILERVVEHGTGTMARINGYRIAGKTGTAQKFDKKINAYSSVLHTSSFVGFAPVEKPAFAMIVVIDEPQGAYMGGEIAAPLFRQIAERLFLYLHIPPQKEGSRSMITARLRREH